MEIKERINKTMVELSVKIKNIESEWFIISSSAMILSEIKLDNTFDIDILTKVKGFNEFQKALYKYIEVNT